MERGRKKLFRGAERFLKAPKNDGGGCSGGGGGIGTVNQAGPD